jgi:hypothetical protein
VNTWKKKWTSSDDWNLFWQQHQLFERIAQQDGPERAHAAARDLMIALTWLVAEQQGYRAAYDLVQLCADELFRRSVHPPAPIWPPRKNTPPNKPRPHEH